MKLAAKLPKDHAANGVEHGEAAFLARPLEQVVVVAYLGTEKITTDYDKGGREATVQVQAIEIIEDDDALRAVRAAFEHAHDLRVNRAPTLPLAEAEADEEWPACEDCGHDYETHGRDGVCVGLDENEDACECNEYLALCACGHPWGLHDVDTGECCFEFVDLDPQDPDGPQCTCTEFVPTRLGEAVGEPREEVEEIDIAEADILDISEADTDDGARRLAEALAVASVASDIRALHAAGVSLRPVRP